MAAIGNEPKTEPEYVRAYVGALLFAEAMADLRVIRRALTQTKNE